MGLTRKSRAVLRQASSGGGERQNDATVLAGRKVHEACAKFLDGESMSLVEVKLPVRQFLATQHLADLEESIMPDSEKVTRIDIVGDILDGGAHSDLNALTGASSWVREIFSMATLSAFVRYASWLLSISLYQLRPYYHWHLGGGRDERSFHSGSMFECCRVYYGVHSNAV